VRDEGNILTDWSFRAPDSQRVIRGLPLLLDYAQRIHDRYFPDYIGWN